MNKSNIFVVLIIIAGIFGCNQDNKIEPIKTKETKTMTNKTVVYQVFTRLFGIANLEGGFHKWFGFRNA